MGIGTKLGEGWLDQVKLGGGMEVKVVEGWLDHIK